MLFDGWQKIILYKEIGILVGLKIFEYQGFYFDVLFGFVPGVLPKEFLLERG